jgi:hypothetical protein
MLPAGLQPAPFFKSKNAETANEVLLNTETLAPSLHSILSAGIESAFQSPGCAAPTLEKDTLVPKYVPPVISKLHGKYSIANNLAEDGIMRNATNDALSTLAVNSMIHQGNFLGAQEVLGRTLEPEEVQNRQITPVTNTGTFRGTETGVSSSRRTDDEEKETARIEKYAALYETKSLPENDRLTPSKFAEAVELYKKATNPSERYTRAIQKLHAAVQGASQSLPVQQHAQNESAASHAKAEVLANEEKQKIAERQKRNEERQQYLRNVEEKRVLAQLGSLDYQQPNERKSKKRRNTITRIESDHLARDNPAGMQDEAQGSASMQSHMDEGQGISAYNIGHKRFGNFEVDMKKLHKHNQLSVRYASTKRKVLGMPNRIVGSGLKSAVLSLLHGKEVSADLDGLEHEHLRKLIVRSDADIDIEPLTKRHAKETDKEDLLRKLYIMLGEIEAGNNSEMMLSNLKSLIATLVHSKQLTKEKALEICSAYLG